MARRKRKKEGEKMTTLTSELKLAISLAKVELLEVESGVRNLTECPGLTAVAKEMSRVGGVSDAETVDSPGHLEFLALAYALRGR